MVGPVITRRRNRAVCLYLMLGCLRDRDRRSPRRGVVCAAGGCQTAARHAAAVPHAGGPCGMHVAVHGRREVPLAQAPCLLLVLVCQAWGPSLCART